MPVSVEQHESTTTVKFQQRCTTEDLPEVIPQLAAALEQSPKLRFDFSSIESVDTPVVQFLLSAADSCGEFLSSQDPFLKTTLNRWGLTPAFSQTQ